VLFGEKMEKAKYLFEYKDETLYMKRLKKLPEKDFKNLICGIILMDIPPAGLLLKYIPAFIQGDFAYKKGKMSKFNLGLGWVDVLNGLPKFCVSFNRRFIPGNLSFKAKAFYRQKNLKKNGVKLQNCLRIPSMILL